MYVLRRFADSLTYSILSRVRILRGRVVTLDWTVAGMRLTSCRTESGCRAASWPFRPSQRTTGVPAAYMWFSS